MPILIRYLKTILDRNNQAKKQSHLSQDGYQTDSGLPHTNELLAEFSRNWFHDQLDDVVTFAWKHSAYWLPYRLLPQPLASAA